MEKGFVYLDGHIPGLVCDLRYFGSRNFIGRPIDGYEAPRAILTGQAARALAGAAADALRLGLHIKIFDAYRPARAVRDFVAWAKDESDAKNKAEYYPDLAKSDLIPGGFIAERSGHSRGSTVDLTLCSAAGELDMGGAFDFFGGVSHYAHPGLSTQAVENRALLRRIMTDNGFAPYEPEWWHFSLRNEPFPDTYFDFPVK